MKNLLAIALLITGIISAQTPAADRVKPVTFADTVLKGQNYRVIELGDHGKNGEITIMPMGDKLMVDWRSIADTYGERKLWTVTKDGKFVSCETYRFDNGLKLTYTVMGQTVGGTEVYTGKEDKTWHEPSYGIGNPIPYQVTTVKKGGPLYRQQQELFDQFARNFLGN